MSDRIFVINGDSGWNFRQLVWSKGLDLFSNESGVTFVEMVPLGDAEIDPRRVIGNFPIDVSGDRSALIDYLDGEIDWLFSNSEHRLVVVAILPIEHCIQSSSVDVANKYAQSDAAQDTQAALAHVTERMRLRALEVDRVANESNRLWLMLGVRELGQSVDQARTLTEFAKSLGNDACSVNSIFGLSQHAQSTGNLTPSHLHFMKLRALIDLALSGSDGWSQRAQSMAPTSSQIGGTDSLVQWVRTNPSTERTVSDDCLSGLLETYEGLKRAEAALKLDNVSLPDSVQDSDHNAFTSDIGKIEAEAGDWQKKDAAERDIDTVLSRKKERALEDQQIDPAREDLRDINTVLQDINSKTLYGFFRSKSRAKEIADLGLEFDMVIGRAATDYDNAVSEITRLEALSERERMAGVRALCHKLQTPKSRNAIKLRGDLVKRANERLSYERVVGLSSEIINIHYAIKQPRLDIFKRSERLTQNREKRRKLQERVRVSEENLLSIFTLLMFPLFFFLVSSLPWIIHFITLRTGAITFKFFGFLPYLLVTTALFSLIVGTLVALKLARKHRRFLKALRQQMQQSIDELRLQVSKRLEIYRNRSTASRWQILRSSLDQKEQEAELKEIDDFMAFLAQLSSKGVQSGITELKYAVDAFDKEKTRVEKVRAFLGTSNVRRIEGVLSIRDARRVATLTLPCSFSEQARFEMVEAGHD